MRNLSLIFEFFSGSFSRKDGWKVRTFMFTSKRYLYNTEVPVSDHRTFGKISFYVNCHFSRLRRPSSDQTTIQLHTSIFVW